MHGKGGSRRGMSEGGSVRMYIRGGSVRVSEGECQGVSKGVVERDIGAEGGWGWGGGRYLALRGGVVATVSAVR